MNNISEMSGMMAVWRREVIVFTREKSRIVASVIQPLMWLVLMGGGLSAAVSLSGGVNYQSFLFPGVLIMTVLFTSVFYGLYIVWDRKIDVLKAVLVAPVSRISIFFGKVLGGCTDSMFQAIIVLLIGLFFVSYSPVGLAISLAAVLLTSIAFVAMGLTIGSFFESFEGFQLINTIMIMPLFLLSGAVFPLDKAPAWIIMVSKFDPVTYAVDAIRNGLLGQSMFPLYVDFAALAVFGLAMIIIGSWSFSRMK